MRKTVIQLVQQVARELNLPQPATVISNQDQNVQKIFGMLIALSDELVMEFDWQWLQTRYQFTTVADQESYPWPTDVERFISGTFFNESNRWPWRGPLTPGQWEWLKTGYGTVGPMSRYRVFDNKFWLLPVPGDGITFVCEYISNNYVVDGNSGAGKQEYEQDSDIATFDHRLLIAGMKAKWLASIGQDTSAALTDFNRALEFCKGQDEPAPTLSLNCSSTGFRLLDNVNIPDTGYGL